MISRKIHLVINLLVLIPVFLMIILFLLLPIFSYGQLTNQKFNNTPLLKYQNAEAYNKPMYNNLMDNYDVTFYKLDLSADNSSAYLEGSVTIRAIVKENDLDTFVVELYYDYTVDSVLINNAKYDHIIYGDEIKVAINPSIIIGTTFAAQVYYHGELSQDIQDFGIGIVHTDFHSVTYTLSEPFFSKFWFPCKQVLEDKADSVYVFVTTDSTLKVGSNGLLTAVTPVGGAKVRYEWKSKYPIAYYLISISIADYIEYNIYAKPDGLEDSILIQNYVYDSAYLENHKLEIDATSELIEIFSELFGMYPFKDEKYGHCLAPIGGGMEHQTVTTLSSFSFSLVAHELAHQWFGDYVTCKTWQDIWINEGFATYSEILAHEYVDGEFPLSYFKAYFNYIISNAMDGSVFIPDNFFDIDYSDAFQVYDLTMRIFDFPLSYVKGAGLLHMIRFELQDDDLFFLTLRNYLDQYRDSTATGLDFKNTLESTSGKDFTDFFNQWYFGEGYPIYNIVWDQEEDTLVIDAIQTTTAEATSLFKMPMNYKIYYAGNDTIIKLFQEQNYQTFKIYIPGQVDSIRVNPDSWVLAKIKSVNINSGNNDKYYQSPVLKLISNPFNEYLELEFSGSNLKKTVILRDISGRIIAQLSTYDQTLDINTGKLRQGIYIIEVIAGDNRVIEKVIKR